MLLRPLLPMSVLFAAGIYASAYGLGILSIIIISALICFGGIFFFRDKTKLCVAIALFLLLGFGRMELANKHKDAICAKHAGSTVVTKAVITDFSEDGIAQAYLKTGKETIKVSLDTDSDAVLRPGDVLSGTFSLSEYNETKAGVFDFSSYMYSEGIYLGAQAKQFSFVGRKTSGIQGMIFSLRTRMNSVGAQAFGKNNRALFNAMVFGDKSHLSPELDGALRAGGLSHIAVVSGMHISAIVVAMVFFLKKLFGKKRYVNICVIFGALFIALVTGMGASVIRALIMCVVYHLSKILYRDSDIYTTIAISAIVMLCINPYYIANVGFVLSLLCVLGIVLFTDKIQGAIKGFLPKWATGAVAVSLSAQLCVMPVLIMNFRTLAPIRLYPIFLFFPFPPYL